MTKLDAAYAAALQQACRERRNGDHAAAFQALERAHVLGQRRIDRHLYVHWRMLGIGLARSDWREVRGQLWRLLLSPFGHLLGRLPLGNTGGANISAFVSLPIDAELQALLDEIAAPHSRPPSAS